jgi:shikimate kinase
MGAGKTTIGQLLARRIGYEFVDSDHVLEARTGVSVATVFEIEGEASFRTREAALIDELSQRQRIVLATGGGAVIDPNSRTLLRARGTVIYLHISAETAYERVKRSKERPLLLTADPLSRLSRFYAQRHPLYMEVAHFVVESHSDRLGAVASNIAKVLLPEAIP